MAVRAKDFTDLGEEEPEIVINLRGCPNGGTSILDTVFLLDCNGRRDSMDGFDIWAVHLLQELPGISGERFDVASLTLSEEGVKSKS